MRRRGCLLAGLILTALAIVAGVSFWTRLQAPGGKTHWIRFDAPTTLKDALGRLEAEGTLKSAGAAALLARFSGPRMVPVGTYRVSGGLAAWSNLHALERPVVQMLRLPATNWAKRDANLLQKHEVCAADDYLREVNAPQAHKADFPLPTGTLEGYLYPDTYDLPPLLGAKAVVGRQLQAFREKVWEPLGHPADLPRLLTVASLVQLEAGTDEDRLMIAGVIENRLKRNMRLQIDASLLYGMGKWRRLTFRDYREFDSPYNLYRHAGLPPTPICSPSIASIRAAMNPAVHNDLYYVALPNGHSLFAATYEEHLRNIERRKAALRALGK